MAASCGVILGEGSQIVGAVRAPLDLPFGPAFVFLVILWPIFTFFQTTEICGLAGLASWKVYHFFF